MTAACSLHVLLSVIQMATDSQTSAWIHGSLRQDFAQTDMCRHCKTLLANLELLWAHSGQAANNSEAEEVDNRAKPKGKESKLIQEVKKLKGWKTCTEKYNSQLLASKANLAGKVRAKQIKKEIVALQSKAQQLIKELQTAFVNCQFSLIGVKALVKRCVDINTKKTSPLAQARPHEKASKAIGKTQMQTMAMKAKAMKKAMKK